MRIWKLEPVNTSEDHWRASTHVGPVIVRAPNETKARSLADDAFGIIPQYLGGADPLPPWNYSSIVTCVQLEDSGFDEEGPDEILGPEEALSRAHPVDAGPHR